MAGSTDVVATVQKLEKNRVALEVEVGPDRLEKALEEAYRRVVRRVNIPGFRPGKAPRAVVEKRLGKQVLLDEALESLLPASYREALEANDLEPIDDPKVDILQLEDGKPFRFKAEVEVRPEVELGQYAGVEAERVIDQVDETRVEEILQQLREGMAELASPDPPRQELQEGDYATVDYEALLEGKPFSGGAAKGRVLVIGRHQLGPGADQQLIGAKIGETREISVQYPEDHANKDLAGKTVTYRVTLQDLKVRRLPELDDEFAKDVSDKATTLEELRQQIRQDLEAAARRRAEEALRDQLIERVSDAARLEVPQVLVRRRTQTLLEEFADGLARRGIPLNQYLEITKTTPEELQQRFEPDARRQVRSELVLDAIAAKEGLTVTEDELQARLQQLFGEPLGEDRYRHGDHEHRVTSQTREAVREALRREKVVDFLVDHAQITERFREGSPSPSEESQEGQKPTGTEQP